MSAPRNVPLIERQADARVLAAQIEEHRRDCTGGKSCPELAEMRAELTAIRREIATWFDPPADAETLF